MLVLKVINSHNRTNNTTIAYTYNIIYIYSIYLHACAVELYVEGDEAEHAQGAGAGDEWRIGVKVSVCICICVQG